MSKNNSRVGPKRGDSSQCESMNAVSMHAKNDESRCEPPVTNDIRATQFVNTNRDDLGENDFSFKSAAVVYFILVPAAYSNINKLIITVKWKNRNGVLSI